MSKIPPWSNSIVVLNSGDIGRKFCYEKEYMDEQLLFALQTIF